MLDPLVADLDAYDGATAAIGRLATQQAAAPDLLRRTLPSRLRDPLSELVAQVSRVEAAVAALDDELSGLRRSESRLQVEIAGHRGRPPPRHRSGVDLLQEEQPARRQNSRTSTSGSRVQGSSLWPAPPSSPRPRSASPGGKPSCARFRPTPRTGSPRQRSSSGRAGRGPVGQRRAAQPPVPSQQPPERQPGAAGPTHHRPADRPGDLPFAGELIQVRTDATEWEGAAERVLHNFSLSMLVPNRFYDAVATWINEHHLAARLVYFRVPAAMVAPPLPDRPGGRPLLLDQLEIRPDTPFHSWLESELGRRANHCCVDTMAEFRSTTKAVTRPVRSRNVTATRRTTGAASTTAGNTCSAGATRPRSKPSSATGPPSSAGSPPSNSRFRSGEKKRPGWPRPPSLASPGGYQRWDEVDWEALVNRVAALEDERRRILRASDRLSALTAELATSKSRSVAAKPGNGSCRSKGDHRKPSRNRRRKSWPGSGLSSPRLSIGPAARRPRSHRDPR